MRTSSRTAAKTMRGWATGSASRSQQGAALIFALMALIALSLASVALVRSIDSGTLVVGNLGFKQDATAAGDQAAEQAMAWLSGQANGYFHQDHGTSGYYATSLNELDPTGESLTSNPNRAVVDWNDDGCSYATSYGACLDASAPIELNGTTSRYVITRLCSTAGDPDDTSVDCATPYRSPSTDPNKRPRGSIDYENNMRFGRGASGLGDNVYYRIIVRTEGGRKTVSYTETIIVF